MLPATVYSLENFAIKDETCCDNFCLKKNAKYEKKSQKHRKKNKIVHRSQDSRKLARRAKIKTG